MPRDLCQREELQRDLRAALGPLTQLGGTIQKLPQGPQHSEACGGRGGGAGLCKWWSPQQLLPPHCHPPDFTAPTATAHQTFAGWCPSTLNSRTQALRVAWAWTRTWHPCSWRARWACSPPPERGKNNIRNSQPDTTIAWTHWTPTQKMSLWTSHPTF